MFDTQLARLRRQTEEAHQRKQEEERKKQEEYDLMVQKAAEQRARECKKLQNGGVLLLPVKGNQS